MLLPEPLRVGATGEALQAIVDLDFGELASIEPPPGFGRDWQCGATPGRAAWTVQYATREGQFFVWPEGGSVFMSPDNCRILLQLDEAAGRS